ncbi:MAG: DUF4058 family protein [Chloroflexi bacterium]|nr:DUF4058 family protein [Ardenticatenaceae bacterium]NOG34843.1 DUF4058 family protein [Chloroflexota bacterium]GIK57303.1 MAG: hypothetical protein BroJett015_29660 [Chloroflexota bacterium]
MPSPFPGMDPYLEGSEWQSFHAELSAEGARQLGPKLRPNYIARTVRRFVMDMPDEIGVVVSRQTIIPDTGVYTAREPQVAYTAVLPPLLKMATIMPEKVPVYSIEIRDVANRQLATAIQIVSPTNKRGEGYREYVEKRNRILGSATHLLEIDLLRQGRRVPMQQPLPEAPYFIFLSRAEQRPLTDVWPIQLTTPLPAVPVPLLPGDEDVTLDLQQAFTAVYDDFGYDLSVDYTQPPEIPLAEETAVWADKLLQQVGFKKVTTQP